MSLTYHQHTFEMLHRQPIYSSAASKKIGVVQELLGQALPASLREWYTLEQTFDLLKPDPELDFAFPEPYSIEENLKLIRSGPPQPRRWWVVSIYNSGVSHRVSLPNDETDPVVMCLDTDMTLIEDSSEWIGARFSTFVFACCWEMRTMRLEALSGTDPSFSAAKIDLLIDLFHEGPHYIRPNAPREMMIPGSSSPGRTIPIYRFKYRFYNQSGLIEINSQDDPLREEIEARWSFFSPNEDQLFQLVSQVKERGIIPFQLSGKSTVALAVLQRFR